MSFYKNTKSIRAEYCGPEVCWDLDEELGDFNDELEEGQTPYTKDDIADISVMWNRLYIEFSDGETLEADGYSDWEIDTKRPKELRGFSSDGYHTLGPDYGRERDIERALRGLIKVLSEEEQDYVDLSAFRQVMDKIEEARKVLEND